MTAFELAQLAHEADNSPRYFADDIGLHLFGGYVYSTPTAFILFRHVPHDAPVELIVNPENVFEDADCDCLHVYLAAGDLAEIVSVLLGYSREFTCFERRGKLRCFATPKLQRWLGYAF